MSSEPLVLLESYSSERDTASYAFNGLRGEIVARRPEEVQPALTAVEEAVEDGLHAAGFLAYEAAPGLGGILETSGRCDLPLVWFGLFACRERIASGGLPRGGSYSMSPWEPSISRRAYAEAMEAIGKYIEAGDTYQVNFTFRLRASFRGDERALYHDLCLSQRAPYCAFLDLGRHQILSASPELFFGLRNGVLTARPMKGTRRRGRWAGEDARLARDLRTAAKERAENVMIVDLLRNDMGRVSEAGSVKVLRLWEVERYETVLQLTSTLRSRLRTGVGFVKLLTALFPCGSVTGAPKIRTTQIIASLEDSPRGIYTGCIGFVSPGPVARFNVAIRTVLIDRHYGLAEFGVGGGITDDSSPQGEYAECLVKARVLKSPRPRFALLETILFEAGRDYFLLDRHLQRLRASADYFGFSYDAEAVVRALNQETAGFGAQDYRVRLTLGRCGEVEVGSSPLLRGPRSLKAAISTAAVDSSDPMLFHKTTHRRLYEGQRRRYPGCDDVVMQNERGEATECCIGNLVVVIGGEKRTPPVSSGLLPGTFRADLLARGKLRECVVTVEEARRAKELYLINSLRRWVRLELVE